MSFNLIPTKWISHCIIIDSRVVDTPVRRYKSNIRNYTEVGRKLLITGSGEAGAIEELGEKIKDLLGDTYSFTISPDILHSAESRQALAACDGVILIETVDHSKYAEVGEETRLIRGMNKDVIGSVLI